MLIERSQDTYDKASDDDDESNLRVNNVDAAANASSEHVAASVSFSTGVV
jgi:hypothetical protein